MNYLDKIEKICKETPKGVFGNLRYNSEMRSFGPFAVGMLHGLEELIMDCLHQNPDHEMRTLLLQALKALKDGPKK